MKNRKWLTIVVCGLALVAGAAIRAQEKKGNEKMVAKGAFDVKMAPVDTAHKDEKAIARYSLDKVYQGDLEAPVPARCWRRWEQQRDRGRMWRWKL